MNKAPYNGPITRKRALEQRMNNVEAGTVAIKKTRKESKVNENSEKESAESKRPVARSRKRSSVSVTSEKPAKRRLLGGSLGIKVDPRFDYDSTQKQNPFAVADFAFDIFYHMKQKETRYIISDYIGNSDDTLDKKHRSLIVDWLCECQESHQYSHETLYMAVRLFDIYLSEHPETQVGHLQSVAGTAFMVASKYEEYEPVLLRELVKMCMDAMTRKEHLKLERDILRAARCDLGFPLSYSFLRRYAQVIHAGMRTLTLARFILEISLHYYECVFESQSRIATAALVLALSKVDNSREWVSCLEYHSGYVVSDLDGLIKCLDKQVLDFKEMLPTCKVVVEKYSDFNFMEVARVYYG